MPGAPQERRRAERFYVEPMRVPVYGTGRGILVDLSEGGALVLFPEEVPVGRDIRLQIEWQNGTIDVDARVRRCLEHPMRLDGASSRRHFSVAVEFVNVPPDTTASLRQILQSHPQGKA